MEAETQQNTYKYSESETQKIKNNLDYQKYLAWLKQNGVLIDPRVRYPAVFTNGVSTLIGVNTTKAIQKGRVVIAVPYRLLITVQKIKSAQPYKKIIEENPDVFTIKQDRPFMILILYICAEMIKGQKSFYFPYFKIAEASGISNWSHWDMTVLQNKQLMHRMKLQIEQIQRVFLKFLRVFRRYQDIFPAQKNNTYYKQIFQKVHTMIATRAFGWSLPSISMIPMADSLNHGTSYLDHYLVDLTMEENKQILEKFGDTKQDKERKTSKVTLKNGYVCRKNIANLSIFNKPQLSASQEQISKIIKPKKSKRAKFIEKHRNFLQQKVAISLENPQNLKRSQNKILFKQYASGLHNLRQLHFYESSCSQDNDTDQETLFQRTYQEQKFIISEKRKRIPFGQRDKHTEKYWSMYRDRTFLEQQEQSQEEQNEKEKEVKKKLETGTKEKQTNSSKGSSQISSSLSSDTDQDYTWFDSQDQKSNIYLSMQTRQKIKENQQLCNFYGRRSNQFLLLGYNFVMGQQNYYDSYPLRIKMSVSSLNPAKLVVNSKINPKEKFTRQIRLKGNRMDVKFINHCRCLIISELKEEPSKKEAIQSCLKPKPKQKGQKTNQKASQKESGVRITIPFDLQVEKKVLSLAKDILKSVRSQQMTSIEEDEELLSKAVKHETIQAIKLRLGYKKILKSNLEMLNLCLDFLKRWKSGKIPDLKEQEMQSVRKCHGYLCELQRSGF